MQYVFKSLFFREHEKADFLTELKVKNSVKKVASTTVMQEAWASGQEITVHGWCYRLTDGHIRDLGISMSK